MAQVLSQRVIESLSFFKVKLGRFTQKEYLPIDVRRAFIRVQSGASQDDWQIRKVERQCIHLYLAEPGGQGRKGTPSPMYCQTFVNDCAPPPPPPGQVFVLFVTTNVGHEGARRTLSQPNNENVEERKYRTKCVGESNPRPPLISFSGLAQHRGIAPPPPAPPQNFWIRPCP